ncbi:hypothetical protein LEAN103870_16895 [Legionella anisa]|uniref:Type IV secretion protein Dot n=1 Tax=Legionella anisa TaxID=28082 RepID=A0AAX0WRV7_9GAMM|nr:hypothetical protein [Legionella anisa]AWN75175.1 hypothetical protein DLD14_15765 [Legionella anisa]KTC66993.1 hypothetical protein Lani_3338 [Legionella anisa]MBN5936606.1 hypothetical protein [Legionella anisa]MCW8424607.1 hypothetical protein [Legionella anisa]MCW8446274.1 hypothetical protein [Legionella anisa]
MKNQKELFEFLCELIDIQIKKYVALPKIGIGPDARLNGQLVFQEVNELLGFAEQLIKELENPQQGYADPEHFTTLFNQIKFYLEQEHLRGYAGWLLDENNIHTPLMSRVNEQIKKLKEIAHSANIVYSPESKPVTETQRQTEYDSVAIAFYILDLALKIAENPSIKLEDKSLGHALPILKRNATTRYNKEEFAQPIRELHKKCSDFLTQSESQKGDTLLDKANAEIYERKHREQWSNLLKRYQKIEPDSKLFASEHEWYKIGKLTEETAKPKSAYSSQNLTLFSGVALGVLVVCMLISYFLKQQNNENLLSSNLNP